MNRRHLQAAEIPAASSQSPEDFLSRRIRGTPAERGRSEPSSGSGRGGDTPGPVPVTSASPVHQRLQVPAVAAGEPQSPVGEDVWTLDD